MTFVEHLSELRLRLRNSAIVFLLATIGSFFFVKKYFDLLTRPARAAWIVALPGQEPVFRFASPTEREPDFQAVITLRPRGGLPMVVVHR